jgi:hypothetical protein
MFATDDGRRVMLLEMLQGFFKKSFSIAIWPILRSSSAIRCCSLEEISSRGRRPAPGNAASPRARHSARHFSSSLGLISNFRATCPLVSPASSARMADIFNSRLYRIRAISIACLHSMYSAPYFRVSFLGCSPVQAGDEAKS